MRSYQSSVLSFPVPGNACSTRWSVSNGGVSGPVSGHSVPSPQDSGLSWQLTWRVVPSPNVGSGDNVLDAVAALSANDIWAVGSYTDNGVQRILIEHWDGTGWQVVPSPNVGAANNALNGIATVSAHDIWTVGYTVLSGVSQTLTEHWDGTSWSVIPSPNLGVNENNVLNDVAALATDNVWAVGSLRAFSFGAEAPILAWDGTSWNLVPGPGGYGSYLHGVWALPPNDIWAVWLFAWYGLDVPSIDSTLEWHVLGWAWH